MKLLESRLAVATPLIPALYFVIMLAPPFIFFLLAAAAILRAQYEFYKIYYHETVPAGTVCFGLLCGFLLLFLFYFIVSVHRIEFWVIFIVLAILLFHLFHFRTIEFALLDTAIQVLGVFYVTGLLGHLILIRHFPDGASFILFLLIVVWGNDAGAYYVGRKIGGKKLYPAISPNKTVSGAIGGFVIGTLLGCAAQFSFLQMIPLRDVIFISILLVAAGQLGDLAESMFKRSGGVKDSSSLIPAHGGLLDKLDGVAFSAPVLYYCILWF
ncbi:MAG: phosphatidate cytidylyltransferase [Nitrospirota bacterium]